MSKPHARFRAGPKIMTMKDDPWLTQFGLRKTMTTNADKVRPQTKPAILADATPQGVEGTTTVETEVIAAIAGYVATQVEGVSHIGGDSMLRRITDAVGSDQRSKGSGIEVEAGKKEAIFDLEISVRYGRPIPEIVSEVRRRIAEVIAMQVGLRAKEINITVSNIEFDDEDHAEPSKLE
jgi:uncharacterized alkaline shock family protein YloU